MELHDSGCFWGKYLIQLIEKVPCFYGTWRYVSDETLYRFTTYLVRFHSFWWLLSLQNGSLICQMIQRPSIDKPFISLFTIFSVISHTADEKKCVHCFSLTDIILSYLFEVTQFNRAHNVTFSWGTELYTYSEVFLRFSLTQVCAISFLLQVFSV